MRFVNWFKKSPLIATAFAGCKCPADVCQVVNDWMWERASWSPAASVEEAWKRGYGNCEDFARLVAYGCESACPEFNAEVWFFWPMVTLDYGHAIAQGVTNDGLRWMADMSGFEWIESWGDLLKQVSKRRGWKLAFGRRMS